MSSIMMSILNSFSCLAEQRNSFTLCVCLSISAVWLSRFASAKNFHVKRWSCERGRFLNLGQIVKSCADWFEPTQKKRLRWLHKEPHHFYPFSPARGILNFRSPDEEAEFGWLDVDRDYVYMVELKRALLDNDFLLERASREFVLDVFDVTEHNAGIRLPSRELLSRAKREIFDCVVEDLALCAPDLLEFVDSPDLETKQPTGAIDDHAESDAMEMVRNRATSHLSFIPHRTRTDKNAEDFDWLLAAASLVQEDLVLMLPLTSSKIPKESDYYLAAGVVCFPDRWRLREKIGKTLGEIHAPVEHYSPVIDEAVRGFFSRLESPPSTASQSELSSKNSRTECARGVRMRYNYTFQNGGSLHFPIEERSDPRLGFYTETDLTHWTGGAASTPFLRVERQGLRKLPVSRGVLFSIRTYLEPVETIPRNYHGDLENALRSGSGAARTTLSEEHKEHWREKVLQALRSD